MMGRRFLGEEPRRSRFAGAAHFLLPDGEHFLAQCEARFTRERWQGFVTLPDSSRRLEQGDVCHLSAEPLGELRIVIIERVGSHRYEFVALVKPDPFESL